MDRLFGANGHRCSGFFEVAPNYCISERQTCLLAGPPHITEHTRPEDSVAIKAVKREIHATSVTRFILGASRLQQRDQPGRSIDAHDFRRVAHLC